MNKENNLKLAIFIYSLAGGGAERVTSYLLPYLRDKGIDVILVLMNDTITYDVPKDIPIYFLEKSRAQESGILKFLKLPYLAFKYARFLKRNNITHSFSMLTRPCYINIMARWFNKHDYKMIISERNYPSLQYGYPDLQGRVNKFLIKKLYPKADQIISNARESAVDLNQNFGVKKEKLSVIYNPIDKEKIDAITPLENFFDIDYFNLVTVGRLQKVKNHKLLIDAIADLENVRLYIFGEGHLRNELTQQIANNNLDHRVFLMGFEANPFQYLKRADLFIFGSNHEGFPNVLLEAMCCGLPILTTNCKSGPGEIMELDCDEDDDIMITHYGILTPVGNAELLRKGLNYIMENRAYLAKCRTKVLEKASHFDMIKILEQYENEIIN